MEKFIQFKFNRAVWTALLKQEKLNEAIDKFEDYINQLQVLFKNTETESEINYSKKILIKNLLDLSVKKYKFCIFYIVLNILY